MGILINSVPFLKNYFLSSPPHLFLFFVTFFFISIYPPSHYLLCNSIFCHFVLSSGSKPQPPDSLLPSPNSKSPVFRTGSEPLLSPSFPRKSAEPLAGITILVEKNQQYTDEFLQQSFRLYRRIPEDFYVYWFI